MSILARHEIVRELAGTALVQVSRVKTPSKPDGSLVLKRCRLLQDGFSDRRSAVTSFLDSARVQQLAAKAPDSHWAPVHELVEDADGGHYVTDFYPSSAQRLINGQVRLSGPALYAVAGSVLKGLLALRKAADRSHGNLKPTNVLIAGSDEIEEGDVFLSDPADSANPNAHDGGADDLFQLGQLIHQLVLHQPFRPVVGWPIGPSPAWSRLGYAGRRWREFCNHLLDPNALARPGTLEAASAELERIRRRPVWHWVAATAATVVVAALVGAGLTIQRSRVEIGNQAAALKAEYTGWFRELDDAVHYLRGEVVARDNHIAAEVVAPIKAARASEAAGGKDLLHPTRVKELYDDPPSPFDRQRARELKEVLGLVRRTRAALDAWPGRSWLAERREIYARRGWNHVADYLAALEATPGQGASAASAAAELKHVLENRAAVEEDLAALEAIWGEIEKRLQEISGRANGAKTPQWFDEYVRGEAKSDKVEIKAPSDVARLLEHLGDLRRNADDFAKLVRPQWADEIDLARLKADEEANRKSGRATYTWDYFWGWGRELDEYRLEPIAADVVDAYARDLKRFAKDLHELRGLPEAPADAVAAYENRLAELENEVVRLKSERLARKDAAGRRGALDALLRQYESELAEALQRASPQEPAGAWAEGLPGQFDAAEPPLKDAWLRLLEQRVPARPGQLRGQPYARLRNEMAALATALRSIPRYFPPPPKAGEDFDPVIELRRRSFIQQATTLVGAQAGPVVDEAKLAQLGKDYDQWLGGMRQLSAHWQAARELLAADSEIEAKGPTGLSLSELEEVVRKGLGEHQVPEPAAGQILAVFAPLQKLREDTRRADALQRDAEAMKLQGDLPAALKSYQEVVKLRPRDLVAAAEVKALEASIGQRAQALAAEARKELAARNFAAAEEAIRRLAAWSPQHVGELQGTLETARVDAARQAVQPVIAEARGLAYEAYDPRAALEKLAGQNQPEVNQLRKTIQDLMRSAGQNAAAGDQLFERRQYAQALDAYRAAAIGGSGWAMFRLGVMSRDGLGVRPDEDDARAWFEVAQKNGHADAGAALAQLGNARRVAMQLREQLDAAAGGDPEAQARVARTYESQGKLAAAIRFYGLAADQDHAPSKVRLARMYFDGDGLPKDEKKARRLYAEAAQQGNREASEWLAKNPDKPRRAVRRIGDATVH